jgi:spore maturation protein CgeB
MKIVLAAPQWETGQWGLYCHRALEQLGHTVTRLECGRRTNAQPSIRERLRRKQVGPRQFNLERLYEANRQDNLDLVRVCTQERPDVVLLIRGDVYLPETVHFLTDYLETPVLNWCGDDPTWFPNILGCLRLYTRFYIVDPSYLPLACQMGARGPVYLPHAADPDAYQPYTLSAEEEQDLACDVIFVGDSRHVMGHLPENWHRADTVEAVARLGVDLRVYGKGWESLPDNYKVKDSVRGRTLLPAERVARSYRAAGIVLNVHHPQLPQGCNQRTFEAPACGSFTLVDHRSELSTLFVPEKEIAVFHDATDLQAKVQHYLAHEDERVAIAARGRERVLDQHTYIHRMKALLQDGIGKS